MRQKYLIFTIIILAIIGIGLVVLKPSSEQNSPTQPRKVESSEIDQEVIDFELEDFQGNKVKLSSFSGHPILIDFWAAWCPFCLDEMSEIEKIHQEFGPSAEGLVVLGIHRSETENVERAKEFAQKLGVTYLLLKDSSGQVYKILTGGRNFMPYALFIDREGKIIKIKAGPKTAEEMREAISKIL